MFDNGVLIRPIGEYLWRVEEDLDVIDDEIGPFTVAKGFVCDLDSVPRWLPLSHALVKGASVTSAVIHDWLYERGHVLGKTITRKQADEVYARAMVCERVSWWKRRMIYAGVRAGGRFAWNKHRDNDQMFI